MEQKGRILSPFAPSIRWCVFQFECILILTNSYSLTQGVDRYDRRPSPPPRRRTPPPPPRRTAPYHADTYVPSRSRSPDNRHRSSSRPVTTFNSGGSSPRDVHHSKSESVASRAAGGDQTRTAMETTRGETKIDSTASAQPAVSGQHISPDRRKSRSPKVSPRHPQSSYPSRSRDQLDDAAHARTPISSNSKEPSQYASIPLKRQDEFVRPQASVQGHPIPSKPSVQLQDSSMMSGVPLAPRSHLNNTRPEHLAVHVQGEERNKPIPTEPRRSTPLGPRSKEEQFAPPPRRPPVIPVWQPKPSLTPDLDAEVSLGTSLARLVDRMFFVLVFTASSLASAQNCSYGRTS